MKFRENSLNNFQVIERTRFCDPKGNNLKKYKCKLWVLRSAHRLMLIDIYMKFREDSLNRFQVIERTRFCDRVQGKQLKKYKCKSYGSCPLHAA